MKTIRIELMNESSRHRRTCATYPLSETILSQDIDWLEKCILDAMKRDLPWNLKAYLVLEGF